MDADYKLAMIAISPHNNTSSFQSTMNVASLRNVAGYKAYVRTKNGPLQHHLSPKEQEAQGEPSNINNNKLCSSMARKDSTPPCRPHKQNKKGRAGARKRLSLASTLPSSPSSETLQPRDSHLDHDDDDKQQAAAEQSDEEKASDSSHESETDLSSWTEMETSIKIENNNPASSSSVIAKEAQTAAAAAATMVAAVVKQQEEQSVDSSPKKDSEKKVEYSSPTQPPPPSAIAARSTPRFFTSGLSSGLARPNAGDEVSSNYTPKEAADKKESVVHSSHQEQSNDLLESQKEEELDSNEKPMALLSMPPDSRQISVSTSCSGAETVSSVALPRRNSLRRRHSIGTGTMMEKLRATRIVKAAQSKRLASLECKNASLRATLVALKNMHQSFPKMSFEREEYAAILAEAGRKHGCTDLNDDDDIKALETALIQQMHHTISTQKQLDMMIEQQRDVKNYMVRCKAWLQDSHVLEDHLNDLQAQNYAMSAVYRNTVKQQEAVIEKYSHLL